MTYNSGHLLITIYINKTEFFYNLFTIIMGNSIDKQKYVHKLKSGKYCVSIPFHCNKTEYNGDIGYGFYIIKKRI